MTWVDLLTLPPVVVVLLWWLLSLSTERWLQAWVLSYVAQGIAAIASVLYLCIGQRGTALAPLGLAAALVFTRWFLGPDGVRRLPARRSRKPRAPRSAGGPTGFWDMWTAWAWRQNPVLAVLLWMAWGLILGGLGALLAIIA